MDDPDVIAYLYSARGVIQNLAEDAINMDQNKHHFIPPRQCQVKVDPQPHGLERWVRAATEPPEEGERNPFLHDGPCLEFRFSKPPKTRKGLVGGRCPSCDIVMPQLRSISWYHFALTFDHENRLVVRDLGSMLGTRVLYGSLSEDAERGIGVDFSTEGPAMLGGRPPIIKIQSNIQFILVVPRHDTTSSTYLSSVARFREGTAATADLFADMALRSRVPTELPTPSSESIVAAEAQVPGHIMWKKELGRGSFAVVHYAWDVQTREEYALKKPLPASLFSVKQWRREAEILKGLRHRNIVRLRHYIIADDDNSLDEPGLYFEYVPKGSLASFAKKATSYHMEQVTLQVLSALEYLHGQEPKPIVHRDIKPENVLVQAWSEDLVQVKLSDFGLSNQGELLKTFCGSIAYLAPEGYTEQTKEKYGPLVDIWSVGVLVFWLVGAKMPKYLADYQTDGMAWAKAIVKSALAFLAVCPHPELLEFAIDYMLVPDHRRRQNVWQCLRRAERLKSLCEPTTEIAQSANHGLQDSNASTIRSLIHELGERDEDAIDSIGGMAPSFSSSFERWDADTAEVKRGSSVPVGLGRVASVLEGHLWSGPVGLGHGEVEAAVEEEDDDKEEDDDDDNEEEGAAAVEESYVTRLHLLRHVMSPETPSAAQYKRRIWDDENDKEEEIEEDERGVHEVDRPGGVRKRARWR